MKRLFNDPYETWNEDANDIAASFGRVVQPIIDKAVEDGISLRDLHVVLDTELDLMLSGAVLHRNSEMAKAARAASGKL